MLSPLAPAPHCASSFAASFSLNPPSTLAYSVVACNYHRSLLFYPIRFLPWSSYIDSVTVAYSRLSTPPRSQRDQVLELPLFQELRSNGEAVPPARAAHLLSHWPTPGGAR
jgi:hypothetical protein